WETNTDDELIKDTRWYWKFDSVVKGRALVSVAFPMGLGSSHWIYWTDQNAPPWGIGIWFNLYLVKEDFDPETITWENQPADGNQELIDAVLAHSAESGKTGYGSGYYKSTGFALIGAVDIGSIADGADTDYYGVSLQIYQAVSPSPDGYWRFVNTSVNDPMKYIVKTGA
ncbi:unnamed protein product, partial [marine sediment metagenome]